MPGHKLIPGNAVEKRMHDRPLRRDLLQPALGLLGRQFDRGGATQIHMKSVALHKDAAPYHVSRLANPLQRTPAEAKIHRRLAFTTRPGVTPRNVRGRHRPGDLKDPDEVVDTIPGVVVAPAAV